jgi:hypothetical protein
MNKVEKFIVLVFFMLYVLSVVPVYSAKSREKKQINIFGSLGIATSVIEDPLIDLGIELQLVQGLFIRLELNTHLDSGSGNYYGYYNIGGYYYNYYPGIALNDGAVIHGLSTFGIYKIPVLKTLRLFFQTGLNYMFYWQNEFDYAYNSWIYEKKNGFGAALGAGFEVNLSKKIGLIAGGTYKKLFADQSQELTDMPSSASLHWVKIYVGIFFHLKSG